MEGAHGDPYPPTIAYRRAQHAARTSCFFLIQPPIASSAAGGVGWRVSGACGATRPDGRLASSASLSRGGKEKQQAYPNAPSTGVLTNSKRRPLFTLLAPLEREEFSPTPTPPPARSRLAPPSQPPGKHRRCVVTHALARVPANPKTPALPVACLPMHCNVAPPSLSLSPRRAPQPLFRV
jgi:hypothetical protein